MQIRIVSKVAERRPSLHLGLGEQAGEQKQLRSQQPYIADKALEGLKVGPDRLREGIGQFGGDDQLNTKIDHLLELVF